MGNIHGDLTLHSEKKYREKVQNIYAISINYIFICTNKCTFILKEKFLLDKTIYIFLKQNESTIVSSVLTKES